MKKRVAQAVMSFAGVFAALTLVVTESWLFANQPEVPAELMSK